MQIITGLTIGGLTFDGSNYILEKIDGLGMPLTRLPRFNLPGSSGAYISNALYGERAIKIKGWINVPDNTAQSQKASVYFQNRSNLINALVYVRDTDDVLSPTDVTITLGNGQVLTTEAYQDTPLQMSFSPDQDYYEEFQITLVAPDPKLYSSTESSEIITFPIPGGTPIPTEIPVSLAPSSGGSAVVDNTGSVEVYPIITISAPVVNPYIINTTTNKYIQLVYTLNTGDADVVIDCSAQTIVQGVTDITGVQTSGSTFWTLLPGNNTVNYSGISGPGTTEVSFFPSYLGI